MKPGGGREKGAVAERECAATLQEWWRQLEPEARFVRTPGSGGWHGKEGADVRASFRASGDVMTTAERFPFGVEVKHREDWSEASWWKAPKYALKSPVMEWWEQARVAADELKAAPLLLFRRNRSDWYALLPFSAGLWGPEQWTYPTPATLTVPRAALLGLSPARVVEAFALRSPSR